MKWQWGHEKSVNSMNSSRQNPVPQKGSNSEYTKAIMKILAFLCGNGILSASQKESGNLGDWLRHYAPKATQIRFSIPH